MLSMFTVVRAIHHWSIEINAYVDCWRNYHLIPIYMCLRTSTCVQVRACAFFHVDCFYWFSLFFSSIPFVDVKTTSTNSWYWTMLLLDGFTYYYFLQNHMKQGYMFGESFISNLRRASFSSLFRIFPINFISNTII